MPYLGRQSLYFSTNLAVVIWIYKIIILLQFNHWPSDCTFDNKSTLVQVMAWCCQVTSHYLSQCWPRLMLTHGVARPKWVNVKPSTYRTSQSNCHNSNFVVVNVGQFYLYPVIRLPQCLLTHWVRDKIAVIFQTIFSSVISWTKMYKFRLRFHWSLFLRVQLTTLQHWFR